MHTIIKQSLTALATIAALGAPAYAANGQLYGCGEAGDAEVYVEIDLFNQAIARYYVVIQGDNALIAGPPEPLHMRAASTSGDPMWAGEGVTFSITGSMGRLQEADMRFDCEVIDRARFMAPPTPPVSPDPRPEDVYGSDGDSWTQTPVSASVTSWGGSIRSGPGTEYDKLGSLPLGADVTLLGRTDRLYQGMPWFAVETSGGKTAYIWGGILCDRSGETEGTFNMNDCQ